MIPNPVRYLFVSALALPLLGTATLQAAVVDTHLVAQTQSLLTTFGDPADNIVGRGQGFDGVARLVLSRTDGLVRCSGALLNGGRDILTAAHCLTDDQGTLNTNTVLANFLLPGDTVSFQSQSFTVHPTWNGDFEIGNDLALISLDAPAPAAIPTYDIYRAGDEVGQVFTLAGFGQAGNGNDGAILDSDTRRVGSNRVDALGDVFVNSGFNPLPGSQLAYDFDNGLAANDAFDFFGSQFNAGDLSDLGVGPDEVMAAPGDSGGPALINGQIAGIASFGARLTRGVGPPPRTSDIDGEINSSFGEFGIDTRVSFFANWIDANRSPNAAPLTGDLNADGFVGIEDLNLILALWNQSTAIGGVGVSDPSGDGFVGIEDLNLILGNWNNSAPPSGPVATVPEPSTLALLCVVSCLFNRGIG